MPQKQYEISVFIGRFQTFHYGHKAVIDEALTISDKVVVIVGSSYRAPSLRNPLTFEERKQSILNSYEGADRERIVVRPLEDQTYNDSVWITKVRDIVSEEADKMSLSEYPNRVTLIGHSKDNTSYYLKLFPEYTSHEVSLYKNGEVSGTITRNHILMYGVNEILLEYVPQSTYNVLKALPQVRLDELREEFIWIQNHKKTWESSPYPPTFVTVDAMVVQSGHVLVIKRKARPSKGMLALPGGYLDQHETIIDGVLRELREETKIDVPSKVLKGNVITMKVFDDPLRSERGRIVTHCALIQLPDSKTLPKVKGSDDAEHAMWVPLNEVSPMTFFEDHAFIVKSLIGQLK